MNLFKCHKIYIDFDGVIIDSNKSKELFIENAIYEIKGSTKLAKEALNYFNKNAGLSRSSKLLRYFPQNEVDEILKIYSDLCFNMFKNASPTKGTIEFIRKVKYINSKIKMFILSGGERNEIEIFLRNNNLLYYFEELLTSEKTKYMHLVQTNSKSSDIFIGDSFTDMNVAIKNNMFFIQICDYQSNLSAPGISNYDKIYKFGNLKNLAEFI